MSYKEINKDNIDRLLFEVAKEYKKIAKRQATQIYMAIVGGCSIIINYSFRNSSNDIDSVILGNSVFNEAIRIVGRENGLPDNWINNDFETTNSYSDKLFNCAKKYKCFCGVLDVYTVNEEYLIAMKLASFRSYKNDKSDIVGILNDMYENGREISLEKINDAVKKLYGDTGITDEANSFIKQQIENNHFLTSMEKIKESEKVVGDIVKKNNKSIKNKADLDEIIKKAKELL